ncbi:MAG TPA: OadG family protein [Mariniphaga sp.]|nr:OadG family protein [Mariniphaga sp.]
MEEGIGGALVLMAIGMITVFMILWLVVIIGNLLIRFTNKYVPAPVVESKVTGATTAIPAGTLAAIVAAIEAVTGGKGKVTNIEKE